MALGQLDREGMGGAERRERELLGGDHFLCQATLHVEDLLLVTRSHIQGALLALRWAMTTEGATDGLPLHARVNSGMLAPCAAALERAAQAHGLAIESYSRLALVGRVIGRARDGETELGDR